MHLIQHLFDDIVAKGVTRNFTTKTFEKMHGPAKESYKRRTNFKNVAIQVSDSYQSFTLVRLTVCQILKSEHAAWIIAVISHQLMQLDKAKTPDAELSENVGENVNVDASESISEIVNVDASENATGSRPMSEAMSSPAIEPHFTLGSKQPKRKVIRDLQAVHSRTFDPAFTSFCSRVSHTINVISSKSTNVVQDSQEVMFFYDLPVL